MALQQFVENMLPKKIYISKGVKSFSDAITDTVYKIAKNQHIEWDLNLLALQDDEQKILRRAYLSSKSYVHSSGLFVDGRDISVDYDNNITELRRKEGLDYLLSGLLHSHAGFSTFFSSIDHTDAKHEGVKLAEQNLIFDGKVPFDFFESPFETKEIQTGIEFANDSGFDPIERELLPSDELLRQIFEEHGIKPNGSDIYKLCRQVLKNTKREYLEPVKVGLARMMVVNSSKSNPFGILGYYYKGQISSPEKGYFRTKEVPVEIVEVENDMTFNSAELESQLRRSLRINEMPPEPKYPIPKGRAFDYVLPPHIPQTQIKHTTARRTEFQLTDNPNNIAARFYYACAYYITNSCKTLETKNQEPSYRNTPTKAKYQNYVAKLLQEVKEKKIGAAIKKLDAPFDKKEVGTVKIDIDPKAIKKIKESLTSGSDLEKKFIIDFGAAESIYIMNTVIEEYLQLFFSGKHG